MANLTITNVDNRKVEVENPKYKAETFAAAGAETYLMGTLLARKEVADAIVAAADAGNTGDGTVTLATVVTGPVIPLVGAYNLECTAAVTNGGVFKLEDPNGMEVANDITMTPGAGGVTVIEVAGMQFTITDGATDFIVGDKFSLTVAADGTMVVYAAAGAGGAQIPKQILTVELVTTGAGNNAVRPLVSGEVNKNMLVIHGGAAGVGITDAIIDQLRDFSIIATDVADNSVLDNQ